MIQGRCSHSIIEFREDVLLAICGWNVNDMYLATCESFSVNSNQWRQIAPLKGERWHHATFLFNEQTVYVCGGFPSNSMEKVEFDGDLNGEWVTVNIDFRARTRPIEYMGSMILNERDVMLFGGKSESREETKDCLLFDRMKETLTQSPYSLSHADTFYRTLHASDSDSGKHTFVSRKGSMHIFNGVKWEYKD